MYTVSSAGQSTRSSARLRSSALIPITTTSSPAKRRRVNPTPLPQLFLDPDDDDQQDKNISDPQNLVEDDNSMDIEELNDIFKLDEIPSRSIYNRIKRPAQFVCPFSAPDRINRCTSFEQPRKRKVQISNHLRNVQEKADEQHPANDDLWNSPLIQDYYLVKRPKYNEVERALASKESNKNHYERRKLREQKWLPKLQKQFNEGKLEKETLRRMLVGKNRLEFDLQITVADKVKEKLELEIQKLRQETVPPTNLIKDLEDKRKELEQSHQIQDRLKQQAVNISREIVGLFGHSKTDTLLSSNLDLLAYAGLSFPTIASSDAFYFFAAYLTPKLDWTTTKPWEENSIRDFKVILTRQCKTWSQPFQADTPVAVAARAEIENRLQVFNASCDLVSNCREESIMYNEIEAEKWEQEQGELWESAQDKVFKAVFQDSFTGVHKSPLALVATIQNICKLVRGVDKADERSRLALNAAQQVLTMDSS